MRDWGLPLPKVVGTIARYKMEHAQLLPGVEQQVCFVLTQIRCVWIKKEICWESRLIMKMPYKKLDRVVVGHGPVRLFA